MIFNFFRRMRLAISQASYSRHYADFDAHRGRVVATWAGIESALDQANHLGWSYTRRSVSNVVPINFVRKVALFRKLHREVPLFAAVADEGTALIDRIVLHLEDRHFLVHGFNVPVQEDRTGWTVRRHIFSNDGFEVVERRFAVEELRVLGRELTDIVDQAVGYVDALLAEFEKHFAKDGRG